jgi:hypothetical protein
LSWYVRWSRQAAGNLDIGCMTDDFAVSWQRH